MNRSGYTDHMDDPLAYGRWRAAVKSAVQGKRGQAFLAELLEALDAMPEKRLYPGSFSTPQGEFCALGALGTKRGTQMDDLGDEDWCDRFVVGKRFGIAPAMAAEIMFINDLLTSMEVLVRVEICGPMRADYPDFGQHIRPMIVSNDNHATERWQRVRAWLVENIATQVKAGAA